MSLFGFTIWIYAENILSICRLAAIATVTLSPSFRTRLSILVWLMQCVHAGETGATYYLAHCKAHRSYKPNWSSKRCTHNVILLITGYVYLTGCIELHWQLVRTARMPQKIIECRSRLFVALQKAEDGFRNDLLIWISINWQAARLKSISTEGLKPVGRV
jgi:hypothetical protein